jgi:hypothetical protein
LIALVLWNAAGELLDKNAQQCRIPVHQILQDRIDQHRTLWALSRNRYRGALNYDFRDELSERPLKVRRLLG